MSQTPTTASASVRLVLLLLVVAPAVPGLIFLLVGLATDPHWRRHDSSPGGEARYAQTWERTRGLYLAGGAVLLVGTLGMGAVVWKIARPGKFPDDEENTGETGR